ncbi:hypothetical protein [Moorena producens]|uniref:hypothetical protein n=1 Tax=Moorena producens TaxID=1155739 RepID=UPI0011EA6E2D|nr:hypothetical protein [Moorena producens]
MQSLMGETPKTALHRYSLLPTGCISFLLFDTVVRYGAACPNPDYEAKNEGPPEAPLGKFSKLRCTLPTPYSLLPTPYSLLPTPYSLCYRNN